MRAICRHWSLDNAFFILWQTGFLSPFIVKNNVLVAHSYIVSTDQS